MAHSLPSTAPATPIPPICSAKKTRNQVRSLRFRIVPVACSEQCSGTCVNAAIDRRSAALGLVGAVMALNLLMEDKTASAAGRRPPPGPPKEKTDPNVTGLAAKILASKKRKEAMKEAVAKERQKGKPAAVQQE